ncbi:MAG: DNA-3-methyladenine glycosylase [Actinomycetes bacterium]
MTEPHVLPHVLPRAFLARQVLEVAPDLLGCLVEHRTREGAVVVRLTEVEAYDGANDPGSHAYRGRTRRNGVMFGPPGHVYVYFSYGMHWCMNLVCGPDGQASAVLLRAGEVVAGEPLARRRRAVRPGRSARTAPAPESLPARDLARGPARLTQALGVERGLDGTDACDPESAVRILAGQDQAARPGGTPSAPVAVDAVRSGPRTGVAGDGAAYPWRFHLDGEPTVSPYRPAAARRRRMRDSGS